MSIDVHFEMILSLFLTNWLAGFGCDMIKCHGLTNACTFYTKALFIIKKCFSSRSHSLFYLKGEV